MTQHTSALAWAKNHLGETEHPRGSNRGPFVQLCQSQTWLPGTGWPWCVAFWIAAWKLGAKRKLPYLGAGAYAFLDWHRRHLPAWVVPIQRAKPGAACVFNVGAGHLSMLAKPYSATAPYVETIDGNVSDQVARRRRHVKLLRGVVDPPETVKEPIKRPRPPVYEVVTSASGHSQVVYVSGAKAISRKLDQLLRKHGKLTIRRRKKSAT